LRTRRASAAISASGRRNPRSRSRRLTMPTSTPSSLTTGSLLTWRAFISRTAAASVASWLIVIAGEVISSPAVSARCSRLPGRSRQRGAPAASRRIVFSCAASRSDSVTTPPTRRPITRTGRPLSPCSFIRRAISLNVVVRSTVTTEVVITSLTPSARRRTRRCPSSDPGAPVSSTAAPDSSACSPRCSSTVSRARVTSDRVALPCSDS
jgi:hypothetical protein